MKLDTQLWGLQDAADRAARLASLGIDGVFTFEGPHDVFTPLVVTAAHGVEVDLYTNLAIALPRNPLQVAHQAWDLQTLTGGRFALGIGSQVRPQIERRYGAAFHPPLARMREFVAALRAIFATWQDGEPLAFEGEYHRHTLMPPLFNPGPNPHGPPPIWMGGLGPKMVELAATVADGLAIMPFCTERYLEEITLPGVEAGLRASERTRRDLTLIGEAIVCCGRDDQEMRSALEGTRMLLAFYGSTPAYRKVLDLHGWGELQEELRTLTRQGRWEEMAGLVDDEMLRTLAVVGSPSEVGRTLTERFGSWADRVAFYFPYSIADATIGELTSAIRRPQSAPQ
jgi:probable F420-dependent oxidoreductase